MNAFPSKRIALSPTTTLISAAINNLQTAVRTERKRLGNVQIPAAHREWQPNDLALLPEAEVKRPNRLRVLP